MAIYDNNGTTNYEIGKLYDNNGTTNYQIGKVYDHNGTTNSLIYTAEKLLVDGSTNSLGTPSIAGGRAEFYFSNGLMFNVWGEYDVWFEQTYTFPNKINATGYSTLCFDWNIVTNGYGQTQTIFKLNGNPIQYTGWQYVNNSTVRNSGTTRVAISGTSNTFSVFTNPYALGSGIGSQTYITRMWLE